ncbi:sugar phosphate isomerase/epimerase family protein [Candidatus Hydrogenedentota bacterium]
MRLGGPILNPPDDPEELAQAHADLGYRAARCPRIPISDKDRINATREAFDKRDIIIAEAGAWCNLISPNDEQRKANFEFVCERFAVADEIGALCCVDFIGTLDPDSAYGPHADNLSETTFDLTVETIRKVINEVNPKQAKFCLEMMQWTFPDSPDNYLDLIKAVDNPSFAVHLDPVNLIVSPRMYFDTTGLLKECFEKLGAWIVSCHAKDIVLRGELSLHLDETRPGTGNMDYHTYLAELSKLPVDTPLLLEHLDSMEEYSLAKQHILDVQAQVTAEHLCRIPRIIKEM